MKTSIVVKCATCAHEWNTVRRGKAYCPKCGRVVKVQDQPAAGKE